MQLQNWEETIVHLQQEIVHPQQEITEGKLPSN